MGSYSHPAAFNIEPCCSCGKNPAAHTETAAENQPILKNKAIPKQTCGVP